MIDGDMSTLWENRNGEIDAFGKYDFSDIQAGKGVAVIDPHGDLAEEVIGFVPASRTNDVVLLTLPIQSFLYRLICLNVPIKIIDTSLLRESLAFSKNVRRKLGTKTRTYLEGILFWHLLKQTEPLCWESYECSVKPNIEKKFWQK